MQLTTEQKKAIETRKSLSVIASAGTGKTAVLTQRFLHCHFERNTALYNILAFTFTEKASREMSERVLRGTGDRGQGTIGYDQAPMLNISTIHAFCHKILKQNGAKLELKSDFDIYDPDAFTLWQQDKIHSFIKRKLEAKEGTFTKFLKYYGYTNLNKAVHDLLELYLPAIDEQNLSCLNKSEEVDTETLSSFVKLIRDFQRDLLAEKIDNQVISYDDLEILCLKLLDDNPDLLKKLQLRFKHILVDEFQDVSPRQFSLIKKLFNPECNEIFIVGDPKQSIYGFRDANARLFFDMTKMIENHGGEKIYLTETFRTPLKLQKYFNKVFPKVLSKELFHVATTHKDIPDAKIYCSDLPASREKVDIRHSEYAAKITDMIQSLIDSGTKPQEIAILFYAKNAMEHYQKALKGYKIQVTTESSQSFFENPLIQTAWHILNFLGGNQDKITQVGILRNPIFSFSEGFIDHLIRSEGETIFSEQTIDLFANHGDRETWTQLYKNIQSWHKQSQTLFAAELFETIANQIKPNQDLHEIILVQKLSHIIRSWQKQDLYYLNEIIGLLRNSESLDLEQKRSDGPPQGVRLLTIHGAKGLEFEHVFLVPGSRKPNNSSLFLYKENEGFIFKTHDCEFEKTLKYQLDETEEFNHLKDHQKDLDLEELKRLVYVALTRTKKSLYFFTERPSQNTVKALEKNPNETSAIKYYNDWLYWLTEIKGKDDTTNTWQPNLFPVEGQKSKVESQENSLQTFDLRPSTCDQSNHTLTATELETFHHCQKRFELKYLKNIRPIRPIGPIKNKQNKTKLSPKEKGMLFHEILQFYEYQRDSNLDTVIDQALFNQHIVDTDDTIRAQCHLFINHLRQDALIHKILFDNLESFEEVEFTCQLENFNLTGQIDKVVKINDEEDRQKWMIIDYKTHHTFSETQRDQLAEQFSFQMSCYALSIAKSFGLDAIDTLILFTSGPSYRILRHDQQNLNNFESILNKLYQDYTERLISGDMSFTSDKNFCQGCGYHREDYCGIKSITPR